MQNNFSFVRRNLEYYSTCLTDAIKSCDYREGNGELVIKIPRDAYSIESLFGKTITNSFGLNWY